jgi:type II secretory pathway pseudopilin PulG
MNRKPAFTLLELLVSATLFASISTIVIGVIGATAVSQQTNRQTQAVTDQLQRVLGSLEYEISRSASVTVLSDSSNSRLAITNTVSTNADGSPGATNTYTYRIAAGTGYIYRADATQYVLTDKSVFINRFYAKPIVVDATSGKKGVMIEISGSPGGTTRASDNAASEVVVRGTAVIGAFMDPFITNFSQ